MRKIKSIPLCMLGVVPALMLSACAGDDKAVVVEPKPDLPAGSVVMLDPSVDDSMLPAIGEQMSQGAVTIYRLDGPQAPIPVGTAVNPVMPATAPMVSSGPRIQLTPPAGVNANGNTTPDPRVTVFDVNGDPVSAQGTTSGNMPNITSAPIAPRILPPPPPTALSSPFAPDGTIAATAVPPALAVTAAPIGADSVATPTKRPPKGMTY